MTTDKSIRKAHDVFRRKTKMAGLESFFEELDRLMLDVCPTLLLNKNPITQDLSRVSTEILFRVMCQYSFFSRDIVSMLREARRALSEWPNVSDELDRNIDEELGGGKPGASHYELLGVGVAEEFGFNVCKVDIEPATTHFLKECIDCMCAYNPVFTAGAVYALEATAVREIGVLKVIACELSNRRRGRPVPANSVLGCFLNGHICSFEPEHKARLRRAILTHWDVSADPRFLEGFKHVLHSMYAWWSELSSTTPDRSIA